MKFFSQLAGLSAAATLILQLGTFVEASPFFAGSSTSIHGNAADSTQQCQDLRFSFPSATGLSFEEQSKHVVAWQAPSTLDKVTLTLVKDDDSTNSSINIGNFDANSGASGELPLDLKGQQPGKYHYHIQATGSAGDCNVDSVAFTIEQQKQQQGGQHDNNDETFDHLVHNIQSQPPSANDHTDAQLDDLISNLKHTQNVHSNDETFDNLVQNIQSQSPSANDHTDAQLDDLISNFKHTQNVHSNDETFDNLVQNIQSQPPSANDHTDAQLDGLVDDLKQSETQHHHSNDQVIDGLVNDLKASSASRHANDQDLDDLISHLPSKQQPGHQDAALDSELDSLAGKPTDDGKLDTLIGNITKSTTTSTAHQDHDDAKADPDWDAMIDDLNSLPSHDNQQEPKESSTQALELDQVVDDLAQSIKDKTHSDSAVDHTDSESFKSFIDELDQDSTKYTDKNKDSETKQVNHKNDAKVEDTAASHANEWFTNSDLRTKIKNVKRAFIHSLIKRGGGESNDDQRTNVNSGDIHNDAEWAEDVMASRPLWATNGGFFTNDDQRANVNAGGGVHNDAEWAEDAATDAATEEDGVWHMDEIVDAPEWTVDDAPTVLDHHQNSIWESAELADEPAHVEAPNHHHNDIEWNVPTTTQEQAPNHHHNDIEWNVPTTGEQAPNHHHNDIEWSVNDNGEDSVADHTNFVHWDAETDDIEDENDDDDHMNAAPEGEWVDDDDHTNAGDDNLEWAQDSVEAMEDDDETASSHDNGGGGEWQTDEHANDDDDLTDNNNRWSLNEDVTEWNTNAFDENDDLFLPNVPSHANNDATDEWRSSEHANDDDLQDDGSMSWNVNDGPSEWSVDDDDDAISHSNAGVDQAHGNDATLTSQWLTDEHANDDDDDEWNVNEASTGWSVNEASSDWTTTTGQHANANEWNVNEATGDWNTDPAGESIQSKSASSSHSNAAPQWLTAESVHSNDVNW